MKQAEKIIPFKLPDTKKLAQNLLNQANLESRRSALVVGLYGDLGSGKTTFAQFFGEAMGVKEKILSPTFVIEKIYKINHPNFDRLIHIDAYRLESPKEMLNLGWKEIVGNPRNIICVEWADRIAGLIPPDSININFFHRDEESRTITLGDDL